MSPTNSPFRRSPHGTFRNRKVGSANRMAFSLIELLAVLAVVTVITGLSVPALNGINGGNTLNTATAKLAGLMTVARSEAISRHTVVRFVVARDWPGKQNASLRRVSLWAWDPDIEQYAPLTPWEDLPDGIILEPNLPQYVRDSSYAKIDRASVHGSCVLDPYFATRAEFNPGSQHEPVDARYIEFSPAGNLRIPDGAARNAIFVATNGFAAEDGTVRYAKPVGHGPANWAQLNIDALTGRVRVYQP